MVNVSNILGDTGTFLRHNNGATERRKCQFSWEIHEVFRGKVMSSAFFKLFGKNK